MSNTSTRIAFIESLRFLGEQAVRPQVEATLEDLLALPINKRPAAWLSYDHTTKVAIVIQLLTNENVFFEHEEVVAKIDELDARALAKIEASAPAARATADHAVSGNRVIKIKTTKTEQTRTHTKKRRPMITIEDLGSVPPIDSALAAMIDIVILAQADDSSLNDALKTVRKHLANPQTRILFTGPILYVTSASESGRIHQTDGATCTCRGADHARCWHRMLWHRLMVWAAVVDPTWMYSTTAPEHMLAAIAA